MEVDRETSSEDVGRGDVPAAQPAPVSTVPDSPEALTEWRLRLGLPVRDAAQALGVSISTLSTYTAPGGKVPKAVAYAAVAIEAGIVKEPLVDKSRQQKEGRKRAFARSKEAGGRAAGRGDDAQGKSVPSAGSADVRETGASSEDE